MRKKKKSKLWLSAIGAVMIIMSSPCVIAMIHDMIVGTDNMVGALIVGGFCTLVALTGIILTVLGIRSTKAKPFEVTAEVERHVLHIAHQHGGRLTTSELALYSELSLDEGATVLQHLEMRDAARTHISDGGDIVYVFPHFDEALDKQDAYDPTRDEVVFDRSLEEAQAAQQDEQQEQPQTQQAHSDPSQW